MEYLVTPTISTPSTTIFLMDALCDTSSPLYNKLHCATCTGWSHEVLYIQMLVFVIVEHLLMLLKMLLAYVIPDSPRWVVDATARAEFSKAVKKDHKQRRLTIDGMNDADLKRRKDAKAAKLKADIDAQKLRLNDPTDGSSKARSMSGFV